MAKIKCLLCGKEFDFLGPHVRKAHKLTLDEYKIQFNISPGVPLASDEFREMRSKSIHKLIAEGRVNHDHLPAARELSRGVSRIKRGEMLEKQRKWLRENRPFENRCLLSKEKMPDGRNAERAREYQRAHRAKKRCDEKPMQEYREKWITSAHDLNNKEDI